jgi:hypothetical protein
MVILLKKFGTTLIGRQFGRESFAAFKPSLNTVKNDEKIEIDFEGVITFTPSWGDAFFNPLIEKFGDRIVFKNTQNLSVQTSLKLLEKIYGKKFRTED